MAHSHRRRRLPATGSVGLTSLGISALSRLRASSSLPADQTTRESTDGDYTNLWGLLGTEEPAAPASTGWPAPVSFRPAAWDGNEYLIQPGDTLSGLSGTYLGNPARFREIWDLQMGVGSSPTRKYIDRFSGRFSMDGKGVIPGVHYLIMPQEAADRAATWIAQGVTGAPAIGGSPGYYPTSPTPEVEPTDPKTGSGSGRSPAGPLLLVAAANAWALS